MSTTDKSAGSPPAIPISRSLLKLLSKETDTSAWFHVGIKGDGTLKLREIPTLRWANPIDGLPWEKVLSQFTVEKICSPEFIEETLGVRKSDIAVKYPETLVSIIRQLDADERAKVIPVTTLRRFYEWLRDTPTGAGINRIGLHGSLSSYYRENPEHLAQAFASSCTEFCGYRNVNESFIGNRGPLAFGKINRSGTDEFVRTFVRDKMGTIDSIGGSQQLGFVAVAREVPPMRSTKSTGPWIFDDGRPSEDSGAGGIDLLMKSNDGGLPVVGEIKIGDDATPFYALVQSLSYAVELGTPNQHERLKRHFEDYTNSPADPRLDIYIISQASPENHEPILRDTKEIASRLYEQNDVFSTHVRRIAFLKAEPAAKGLEFSVDGVYGDLP